MIVVVVVMCCCARIPVCFDFKAVQCDIKNFIVVG